MIEEKPLAAMGLSKEIGTYFIGIAVSVFLLVLSVVIIVATGNIKYQGIIENADVLMIILLTGGFMIQGAAEEILCRENDKRLHITIIQESILKLQK